MSACRRERENSGSERARKRSSRHPLLRSEARNSRDTPPTDELSAMTRSDTQASVPSYRGPLIVVIILGVLIVLALGALFMGAILRLTAPRLATMPYSETLAAPGERIESTQLDGNRILVRLSGANGDELVVLDAVSGRVLGRVAVKSGP
jgi:hypothetical protein